MRGPKPVSQKLHALALHDERRRGGEAEHAARRAGGHDVRRRDQHRRRARRDRHHVEQREAQRPGAGLEQLTDDPEQEHVEEDVEQPVVDERRR